MTKEVANFLDGYRNDSDFRHVAGWLRSDEAHVSAFVDQLQVEEDLRRLSLREDVGRFLEPHKQSLVHGDDTASPDAATWARRGFALLALACTLLVAFLATQRLRDPAGVDLAANGTEEGLPAIVATLGDAKDCDWGVSGYTSGQHFRSGATLNLLSGIAQLTFETGAVLVLQGPCDIDLQENAIGLNDGRVSATVPKSAFGFAVRTPSSEVIDLGTEFGVSYDEADGTQVHVFSGEVVTRARNEQGDVVGELLFVTTQNAIHFRRGTDEADRFEADEKAFVRWLDDRSRPLSETSPLVNGDLSLWLANGSWMLDAEQRVNVWRDAVSTWNHMPDNALQAKPGARPTVVQDAIGGMPAVRFDGVDDCLITTPITNADSQTIALVVVIREGGHKNGQIINYNGPPQRWTWKRRDPNILQVVASLGEHRRAHLKPFVYLGHVGQKSIKVGEIDTQSVTAGVSLPAAGEPFVAVYVYDRVANHAELSINNRSIGATTAPAAIGLTSRKVIGRHGGHADYFSGDLGEVLIYDEGLDAARVRKLTERLAAKFRIDL